MTPPPAKIAIIGAGIGGLTAALALKRAGLEVDVYEKTPRLEELGAAIALWPNATRILRDVGCLNALLERSDPIERCEIRSADDHLLRHWRIPACDTPALFTHRADLQTVLAAGVKPHSLHLGRTLEKFETSKQGVQIFFKDTPGVTSDLLVGADGFRSTVQEALHGRQSPVYQGYTLWRAVLPFTHEVLKPGLKIEWWGQGIRFGIALNGLGRMNWYVAANWKAGVNPEEGDKNFLKGLMKNWTGPALEILEATPQSQIIKTDIWARPRILGRWGSGPVTLLGDAAHPTSPNLGQGAGMAIEDASVLTQTLTAHGVNDSALRLYEQKRQKRTGATISLSKFVGDMGQWSRPAAVALRTLFLKNCPVFLWDKKLKASYAVGSKKNRRILFYSEGRGYTPYFQGLLDSLLENPSVSVSYITSDPSDPLRNHDRPNLRVFHFSFLLPFVLLFTNSKVVILTAPDLNHFHIKKSVRRGHYVYLFHSIVSSHMIYREGAFDHYDSILCVGPHHEKEIRKTEELYGLKPKELVHAGYYRLEKLYEEYREFKKTKRVGVQESVLIAPSWGEDNILQNCLPELVERLSALGYRIVIRPHRESVKRGATSYDNLNKLYARENVVVDRGQDGDRFVLEADVLITDWSGAAFSYAFGTERPVLFIDVPRKIRNANYEKLELEPIESSMRPELGVILKPEELFKLENVIGVLKKDFEKFRKNIVELRERTIFNFGGSSAVSARYILSLLKN